MKHYRKCDDCEVRLELVKVIGNYYYFRCPDCGKTTIDTIYKEGGESET